jgi:MYXO-CTERM domain-containing protein
MGAHNVLPARSVVRDRAAACGWLCLGFGFALSSTGCSAGPGLAGDGAVGVVAEAVSGPFSWKGYTWNPTTGGMAGVVPGDAANVTIDSNGQLHLKIVKTATGWSASEVFTTTSLGFGTYQWQIAGPIDRMDHTVVLGLFPYGPAAGIGADGTNEIDTEFSYWNDEVPNVNADWGVFPPSAQGTHWEDDYMFSLNGGSAATARMTWSKAGVTSTLLSGFQPLGSNNGTIKSDTYAPANATNNVPQQPLPLGMNLWCYKGVPSSGQDVEVVIQDFQFVPEGQPIPGDDGGADSGNSPPDASGDDAASGNDAGDGAAGDDAAGDDAGTSDDGSTGDDAAGGSDAGAGPGPADAGAWAPDAAASGDAGTSGRVSDAAVPPPPTTGNADSSSADAGCGCVAAGARGSGAPSIALLGAAMLVGLRRRRSRTYGGCPQTRIPSR